MAKNPNRRKKEIAAAKPSAATYRPSLSKRGLKVLLCGVFLVVVGFVVLTFTDPAGQNWASTLSPLLLVGGYAVIGVGIVTPDAPAGSVPPDSAS